MRTSNRGWGRGLAVGAGSLALTFALTGCGTLIGPLLGGARSEEPTAETATEQATTAEESTADEEADPSTQEEATSEETADEESVSDDATSEVSAASDEDASGAGGDDSESSGSEEDVTEGDLSAAKGQFIDFMKALGDKDAEKACGFTMDPSTGEPIDGMARKVCAKQIEKSEQMDQFTPELVSMLDASMIDAKAEDDGTITLSFDGSNDTTMAKADDGQWYFKL
ncbi:hypothetical protein DEO23_10515 [Brachybacterium endophyticum]|uniref:Uncharacterized protein n=1 Tax=Brachybacterium endophyticum TaxID=2182385 RepID=A0A2U2RIH4_9MICO|nr:hypothetical protein [Brachybacterium endophyticum]PWH05641.1 hypothetical protein DEO23_10515 [Brachybacterium endophyticum]